MSERKSSTLYAVVEQPDHLCGDDLVLTEEPVNFSNILNQLLIRLGCRLAETKANPVKIANDRQLYASLSCNQPEVVCV